MMKINRRIKLTVQTLTRRPDEGKESFYIPINYMTSTIQTLWISLSYSQVHLIVVTRRVGSRSTQLSFHNGDLVTQTSLNKLDTSVS